MQPNTDLLFRVANLAVLPGWLLLIFLPRWKHTAGLAAGVWIPALLAAVYVVLVGSQIGRVEGGFGSLEQVALLFQNPTMLLAGWIHYLAFDLFIGSWEVRDANRLGIRHWLVVPCLVLTFLFGPAGLLLYLAIRAGSKRRISIETAG